MSASTQKMPRPTARDAPRFDGNKSENIRRFLSQMEDLFSDCSITDDAEKKKQLVHYTDADTEEEWKSLDEYDTGTFAKLKEAIVKNYPEAQDVEAGTVNRLTRITRLFKNLGLDEREEENVSARLSIKRGLKSSMTPATAPAAAASAATTTTAKTIVRREDLHTLTEVVAEADDIALNTSGIYGVTEASPLEISSSSRKDSLGLKVEVEEVKQQVVNFLDRLDISEKQSDVRQKQLLEAFQQAKNTGTQQSRPRNNEGNSASANDVCWYDRKLGHYARDCEQTKKHIVEGLLKIVNKKILMSDGSQPRKHLLNG
ncbi:hypothetical protein EV421DRAFT_1911268 [Armillaria borealis]|uniref:CCHC-type domain-containing protein n=1 Tax=Armillaria borealis TaxID=47425 RepID=A0AA39MF77_9AGAR|nr:hypothetical protein EV421DRAFT_1911268 [Armillaria borealis]